MMPLLTIMVPTLTNRHLIFNRLINQLRFQIDQIDDPLKVQVLPLEDNGEMSTGYKRNWCIANATAPYVTFIDDDDQITDCYLKKQLEVAESGADCGYLKGLYFINGIYVQPFLHSIEYKEWLQDKQFFYRSPNHLNCIKKELISDIPYQDKYVGEDGNWSKDVVASGRLKTQYEMKETLYLYYDISKK